MKQKGETLTAYAFLAPVLVVFATLVAFPILFSAYLSFTKWNFLSGWSGIRFIGLDNFKDMFTDKTFLCGLRNTFLYAVFSVPASILLSLFIAYVLNRELYLRKTIRLMFFVPYISSTVALAAVFKYLFREKDGLINMFLQFVMRVENLPRWLADENLNRIPIIGLLIWTSIGFEMIIYMAALQNVPKELYESSDIDGASGMRKFWKITFPMISPTTFFLSIIRIIAVFKVFTSVNVITYGTSSLGNTSIVIQIYRDAFGGYKFGYASAEAWVLFAIIFAVTLIQFWGQKKWVHY